MLCNVPERFLSCQRWGALRALFRSVDDFILMSRWEMDLCMRSWWGAWGRRAWALKVGAIVELTGVPSKRGSSLHVAVAGGVHDRGV